MFSLLHNMNAATMLRSMGYSYSNKICRSHNMRDTQSPISIRRWGFLLRKFRRKQQRYFIVPALCNAKKSRWHGFLALCYIPRHFIHATISDISAVSKNKIYLFCCVNIFSGAYHESLRYFKCAPTYPHLCGINHAQMQTKIRRWATLLSWGCSNGQYLPRF